VDGEVRRVGEEIVRVARDMVRSGLVEGTSGNVSARVGDKVLITPSSVDLPPLIDEFIFKFGGG